MYSGLLSFSESVLSVNNGNNDDRLATTPCVVGFQKKEGLPLMFDLKGFKSIKLYGRRVGRILVLERNFGRKLGRRMPKRINLI